MGRGDDEWDLALGMDHDIILELILDVGMEPFSIIMRDPGGLG